MTKQVDVLIFELLQKRGNLIIYNSDVSIGNQWLREINLHGNPSKSAVGEHLSCLIKLDQAAYPFNN